MKSASSTDITYIRLARGFVYLVAIIDWYPAYFMINCAHPTHFSSVVGGEEPWMERIRGLRANASTMSHAELNEAPVLDAGNPAELGRDYAAVKGQQLKSLNVFGGCCGTDHRHIEQIALACLPLFPA